MVVVVVGRVGGLEGSGGGVGGGGGWGKGQGGARRNVIGLMGCVMLRNQ